MSKKELYTWVTAESYAKLKDISVNSKQPLSLIVREIIEAFLWDTGTGTSASTVTVPDSEIPVPVSDPTALHLVKKGG